MSTPTFELPYGTVTGQYIVIKHDGADEDHLPDVQPLNGSVLLTPTVTAGGVQGALAEIAPVRLRIFGGQIVDEQQNPGARILANDADMVVEDWAWKAQVTFEDSKLRLKPQTFKLATDETVSLTSGLIPVDSAPYQLVKGKPGESAYEVAVRHGYTGTEAEWLASLKGDGSSWDDIAGKPASYPSTIPDVQGLAARLAALEYDSGPRDISGITPGLTSGGWIIQRVGKWVFTNLYDVALTPTASSYWLQGGFLPVGFRPPPTPSAPYVNFDCTVRNANYSPGPLRVDRYGGVTLYGVTGKIIAVTAMWMTNDLIPTTLPGTPA